MCDLGLGLVQGAHIYPAAAPGSTDVVANGLGLCGNHHIAFDRHLIWADPDSLEIQMHPAILDDLAAPATANFVASTFAHLRVPANVGERPDPGMFAARYRHFESRYDWAY